MKIVSVLALSAALIAATQGTVSAEDFSGHRDPTYTDTQPAPKPPSNNEPYDEGNDGPQQLPGHRDASVIDEVSCIVLNNSYAKPGLNLINTGTTVLPPGTKVVIHMPDGSVVTYLFDGNTQPNGDYFVAFDESFPDDWECDFDLILPPPLGA